MKKVLLLALALLSLTPSHAQKEAITDEFYFVPSIQLGYTLGAGWMYGMEFFFGLGRLDVDRVPFNYGLSWEWYMVNVNRVPQRIMSANVFMENNYMEYKLGLGLAGRNWGEGNRNKARTFGWNWSLGVSSEQLASPWLGFRAFHVVSKRWTWYDKPYRSFYLYQKPPRLYVPESWKQ